MPIWPELSVRPITIRPRTAIPSAAFRRAAVTAVEAGMKNVDTLLAKKYEKWKKELAKKGSDEPVPQAQVALVALDPRNGEIKAVVGGRDYGQSQLNHALAHRQPGS